ncbi:MAG: hypothetical protein R3B90_14545 [Planctomycetaceae bacterium]
MLVLALVITRPLYRSLGSGLPLGTQPVATVPLFNLWTLWWNCDRLERGLTGYWQAPIFHPTDGTFAFSEPQPPLLAVAPVVRTTGNLLLAYNVYLLGSLMLNGYVMTVLLRRNTCGVWLAALGGGMGVLLPFVHWQLGVLQLVPVWGVLWVCLALQDFGVSPTARRGALLGCAFGVNYWLCNYYGLFLSVLLVFAGPVVLWGRGLLRWRTWAAIGVSLLVAALLCGPIVWAQLHYILRHDFSRNIALYMNLSSTIEEFLTPWGINRLGTNRLVPDFNVPRQLSTGHLKSLLALVGLFAGVWHRPWRRRTLFWGVLLAGGLLFACGAHIPTPLGTVHQLLAQHWPGFAHIRTLYRFAVFAQLASIVLACIGLTALFSWTRRWSGWRGWLALTAFAAFGLVTTFEVHPPPARLFIVPSATTASHWARWLRDHTPADAVIAHFPFPSDISEEAYLRTTLAMYWQTVHRRRMVNGYSGFFPQSSFDMQDAVDIFPDGASVVRLRISGVRYCVLDLGALPAGLRAALDDWPEDLRLAYADPRGTIVIYEILPVEKASQ